MVIASVHCDAPIGTTVKCHNISTLTIPTVTSIRQQPLAVSDDTLSATEVKHSSFQPKKTDLAIAFLTALGLPLFLGYTYSLTGAVLPMFVYYVVFSWVIVKWRRGRLDYGIRREPIWVKVRRSATPLFFVILALQLLLVVASYVTVIRVSPIDTLGWLATLLLWAPVNAMSEQLIWLYTFDSYADYCNAGRKRTAMIAIGTMLYLSLIGLVHVFFWGKFLLGSTYAFFWTEIFLPIQFVIPIGYVFLYRQTKSMWPIAGIHFLLDFTPVLFSGYSMIPFLLSPV
jgi:hypothetical protein